MSKSKSVLQVIPVKGFNPKKKKMVELNVMMDGGSPTAFVRRRAAKGVGALRKGKPDQHSQVRWEED